MESGLAAHWKVIGITVEGAGKDHASKGGSYDIAMTLCEEVFKYEKPFRLPYEFILIGGKKNVFIQRNWSKSS